MASPQLEKGYTPVSNEILENLVRLPLNGTQLRIIIVTWRYTYGFSRKEHELSETFLSKACGIHKKQIQRELSELISFKLLLVVRKADFCTTRVLAFNKDYESWQVTKKLPPLENDTHTGIELAPTSGSELAPQEINIKTNNKTKAVDVLFDAFWKAYPRKVAKATALKAYTKLKPDEHLQALILKALEEQKQSPQWTKDNHQFVPHAATWLNQRRWEDSEDISLVKDELTKKPRFIRTGTDENGLAVGFWEDA